MQQRRQAVVRVRKVDVHREHPVLAAALLRVAKPHDLVAGPAGDALLAGARHERHADDATVVQEKGLVPRQAGVELALPGALEVECVGEHRRRPAVEATRGKKVLDPAGHRASDPLVDLAPRLLWLP